MKKEPILYGIIGLLVGIIITGFAAGYSVNHGHDGMMRMMGLNTGYMNRTNVDKQFIQHMIPHHESAIETANLALEKSKHEELKTLANNIVTSQTAEINTMRQWYKDWYGAEVPAVTSSAMWGGGMMNSQASAADLSAAADFDEAFLSQMIEHHQMAVMMANMLDISTNRTEMKKLANDIIAAQSKEIDDMESWQQLWGYETSGSNTGGMMNMMGR